jgi:MFS transporter, putative metabolite:H+ symporter
MQRGRFRTLETNDIPVCVAQHEAHEPAMLFAFFVLQRGTREGPWRLTFGKSAIILLASGFGAMFGAVFYGWLADKIGRRKVFMLTVVNFSAATGILTFTPDNAWLFLASFRFIIGFGVGGLYCVDLPLVQEFVPSSKRGMVGGIVTSSVPLGILLGSFLGATMTPLVGWRGLFAIGALPGVLTLLIRIWVPASPRWLIQMGRHDEARQSLAWALEIDPLELPPAVPDQAAQVQPRLCDLSGIHAALSCRG